MNLYDARLLFAAARGARVEVRYYLGGVWKPSDYIRVRNHRSSNHVRRINPADADLQYGPVSSQIRRAAENPPMFFAGIGDLAFAHVIDHCGDFTPGVQQTSKKCYGHVDDLHKSIFFLLLAESLADDGL